MPEAVLCAICHKRKAKRHCPGVRGEICTICCGTEREVTVDCPFECEYLQEARKRDKPVPWTEADIPHPDIKVSEKFVAEHEDLLVYLGQALFASAMEAQL